MILQISLMSNLKKQLASPIQSVGIICCEASRKFCHALMREREQKGKWDLSISMETTWSNSLQRSLGAPVVPWENTVLVLSVRKQRKRTGWYRVTGQGTSHWPAHPSVVRSCTVPGQMEQKSFLLGGKISWDLQAEAEVKDQRSIPIFDLRTASPQRTADGQGNIFELRTADGHQAMI